MNNNNPAPYHLPGVGATPGVGANPPTTTAPPLPTMAFLNKDNLSTVLADARLGRYAALCCVADPSLRGMLDTLLKKYGLNRTLMLLQQACCANPCSVTAATGGTQPAPLSAPGST